MFQMFSTRKVKQAEGNEITQCWLRKIFEHKKQPIDKAVDIFSRSFIITFVAFAFDTPLGQTRGHLESFE